MSTALYDPIKAQAKITDSVIVGFSGGKDSLVTLDLCARYFKNVRAYFLYSVPNLSFQERCLRAYEEKYNLEIIRLPNTDVSERLKKGIFTLADKDVPIIRFQDIYDYLRNETGMYWIAGGERAADSIERNAMLKKIGSTNYEMGRFYPLAWWKEKEVLNYIKVHKLPYFDMKEGFLPQQLYEIREYFPNDWQRLLHMYPFMGAALERALRKEEQEEREERELRNGEQ